MEDFDPTAPAQPDTVESLRANVASLHQQIEGLTIALTTARQIGAAIGIIMALTKVSQDDAFELLRKASQDQNRKLRQVADEVLEFGTILHRA